MGPVPVSFDVTDALPADVTEGPAIRRSVTIGAGHSMGGMQTIIQQAEHASYHAIMILGGIARTLRVRDI